MVNLSNNKYDKYDMLKGNDIPTPSNKEELRENFINEYCQIKGWNKNNLTNEQLSEIKSKKEYKNPGMILG